MATSQDIRASVHTQANEEDPVSMMTERDIAEENGEILETLEVGKPYVFFCVMHYFNGFLEKETYEYYILAPNSVQVFETGAYTQFFGMGKADVCEDVTPRRRIRKAAVSDIVDWPHKQLAKKE